MTAIGILLGLLAGAALGLAAAAFLRRDAGADTARFEGSLAVQAAELRRLADAARAGDGTGERLAAEIVEARTALAKLAVREDERRAREAEQMEVVRRLATVLAGGASKGRGGENVLHERLADLPPGMLVTDFRVNGKVVEYGLLLPDGRRLPVDSKWSAVTELERLEAAEDPSEREAIARDIERIVASRAREVAAYLDPALTAPVAVAAVPDAAYELLRRAHIDAFSHGVVIVPYSSALPILLFLYALVSRFGDVGDVQACLAEIASLLDGIEAVVENKITKAATMLTNGADELRSHLGKARGSMARAQAGEGIETEQALRVVE